MNRFAEAIETSRVDVVPKIVIGAGGGNGDGGISGSGSVLEALLAMLLSERVGQDFAAAATAPRDPKAESLRAEMRKRIAGEPAAAEKGA